MNVEPLPPSPCLSLPRTQRDARWEPAGWQVLQVERVQLQLQMAVCFFFLLFFFFLFYFFFFFPPQARKQFHSRKLAPPISHVNAM